MKRIYISGPMSGMPDKNFPAFNAEAARLRALGYEVVNPVDINGYAAVHEGRTHIQCLRNDVAGLATCDTLAMLPMPNREHRSKGMEIEIDVAKLLEITVLHASRITEPCDDPESFSRGAMDDAYRHLGGEMVKITTTVWHNSEWACIPALWQEVAKERDRHYARIAFLSETGRSRKVEEYKKLWRVYEDKGEPHEETAQWRAMTPLFYASPLLAIDNAMGMNVAAAGKGTVDDGTEGARL